MRLLQLTNDSDICPFGWQQAQQLASVPLRSRLSAAATPLPGIGPHDGGTSRRPEDISLFSGHNPTAGRRQWYQGSRKDDAIRDLAEATDCAARRAQMRPADAAKLHDAAAGSMTPTGPLSRAVSSLSLPASDVSPGSGALQSPANPPVELLSAAPLQPQHALWAAMPLEQADGAAYAGSLSYPQSQSAFPTASSSPNLSGRRSAGSLHPMMPPRRLQPSPGTGTSYPSSPDSPAFPELRVRTSPPLLLERNLTRLDRVVLYKRQ